MQNKKGNKKDKDTKSLYLVISDSSQNLGKQGLSPRQNKVKDQQNIEKPIRERPIEQSSKQIITMSKPSKKVKLLENSSETLQMIRFGSLKNTIIQPLQEQGDSAKTEKRKMRKAVPWLSKHTREIEDVCLRFHNQVVQFYEYIKPSKKQHQSRLKIFNMIKDMIVQKYPQAQVKYFGSFATKMYLPDGDIDVTVLIDNIDEYQERKAYDDINKIIRRGDGTLFGDIQFIRKSKVPLIKFIHIDTQYQFDISVNKTDGLKQIEHVQRMRRIYPEFQPLVFVFKTMLKIRNLSQTYTGGIGSFLLFCMILHYLRKMHEKKNYYTMGQHVMKFMEFYALNYDWERKSIYVADGQEVSRARQPGTLSFLSPQDDSHDIGRNAFKIRDSFNVFKNRFRVITGSNFRENQSILKQLINPSLDQFRYYRYQHQLNKTTN